MKRYEHKTIDLRTIQGFQQAERMQRQGWRVLTVGWHTIQRERAR